MPYAAKIAYPNRRFLHGKTIRKIVMARGPEFQPEACLQNPMVDQEIWTWMHNYRHVYVEDLVSKHPVAGLELGFYRGGGRILESYSNSRPYYDLGAWQGRTERMFEMRRMFVKDGHTEAMRPLLYKLAQHAKWLRIRSMFGIPSLKRSVVTDEVIKALAYFSQTNPQPEHPFKLRDTHNPNDCISLMDVSVGGMEKRDALKILRDPALGSSLLYMYIQLGAVPPEYLLIDRELNTVLFGIEVDMQKLNKRFLRAYEAV